MTLEEFKHLHNFGETEHDIYGRLLTDNLELIDKELMIRIDEAVITAKWEYGALNGRFLVHCILQGDHNELSYHYKGRAIDGHFKGLDLLESAMVLMKTGFMGIGIYPHWSHPGIHADIRPQTHISTWVGHTGLSGQEYDYKFNHFIETAETGLYSD